MLTSLIIAIVVACCLNYGWANISTSVSWRIPIITQVIWHIFMCYMCWFSSIHLDRVTAEALHFESRILPERANRTFVALTMEQKSLSSCYSVSISKQAT